MTVRQGTGHLKIVILNTLCKNLSQEMCTIINHPNLIVSFNIITYFSINTDQIVFTCNLSINGLL